MSTEKELQNAKQYADFLAVTLREAINPGASFVLCEDLPGVLTQIENMIRILLKERAVRPIGAQKWASPSYRISGSIPCAVRYAVSVSTPAASSSKYSRT